MRDLDRVGPFALGHGDRDGGMRAGLAGLIRDVGRWLRVAVTDVSQVPHAHRPAASAADDYTPDIVGRGQVTAGLQAGDVPLHDRSRRGASRVGRDDRTLDGERVQLIGRQPCRIDVYPELTWSSADERHLRHIGDFGDGVAQLSGEPPHLVVAITLGPHGDGHDRYVIDRARLHDGADDARRNAIRVCGELLIEPDEGRFLRLPNPEAHDHHRLSGGRRRVDVLDTRHFRQELLHRSRDTLLDVRRRSTWHLDEDVDHRDDDLRLFLTGQRHDRQRTERQ